MVPPLAGNTVHYGQGFTSEFDMVSPGLTFTKLSGSTYFTVTQLLLTILPQGLVVQL